ncbi:MAG: hypothetical protein GY696_20075 [Gammaproteobacteria bacterium]|nr:hypothetical protein [Gammaproteobacteria bacterium]
MTKLRLAFCIMQKMVAVPDSRVAVCTKTSALDPLDQQGDVNIYECLSSFCVEERCERVV